MKNSHVNNECEVPISQHDSEVVRESFAQQILKLRFHSTS